jgi:3,4-dihydroxy 2-butanone 4-phosphate synthase/GTP cyclohydrolase II
VRRISVCVHGSGRETLNLPCDRDLEAPIDGFDTIADALADMGAGKFLVVLDDESRENEGDLIMSADKVTTEAMAFMVEYTSGVVCISMEGGDLDRLRLPPMVRADENEDAMSTAFTITVDLRDGTTTGISAADRASTVRTMANPSSTPGQFRRPGHVFPLRARQGGVLVRPGHTEAGVDLARLAGCFPAGALSEIVNKRDGSMARTPDLLAFAKQHGLKCISIADLMRYRLRHEQLVSLASTTTVGSRHGPLTVHTFKSALDGSEHLAVVVGDVAAAAGVPTHVQPLGSSGDLLGVSSSEGLSPDAVLARMASADAGVSLYVASNRAGSKPSLEDEVRRLADGGASASGNLDLVDYGLAAQMLRALSVGSVSLVSSDANQQQCLECCGVSVLGAGLFVEPLNGSNGHARLNGTAISKVHSHAA